MRRVLRGAAVAASVIVIAVAVLLLGARQWGVTQITVVALLVAMPFAAVPVAVAAVVLAAIRLRVWAALALALAAVLVAVQVPQFVADAQEATGSDFTVMTINAAHGDADARTIVDEARSSGADILAVQELTQEEVDSLTAAGIDEVFPYSFTAALPVADGTGLWSRTALTDGTRLDGFGFVPVQANTVVGGTELTVVSFHAMSPATPRHTVEWAADLARMRELMDSYPGTTVVAGDFNATNDHRQFRDLAGTGFVDAAESSGAGLFRTFPARQPLARLDHVVVSDAVDAKDVRPVSISGSDHLGVVAQLRLPAS